MNSFKKQKKRENINLGFEAQFIKCMVYEFDLGFKC